MCYWVLNEGLNGSSMWLYIISGFGFFYGIVTRRWVRRMLKKLQDLMLRTQCFMIICMIIVLFDRLLYSVIAFKLFPLIIIINIKLIQTVYIIPLCIKLQCFFCSSAHRISNSHHTTLTQTIYIYSFLIFVIMLHPLLTFLITTYISPNQFRPKASPLPKLT